MVSCILDTVSRELHIFRIFVKINNSTKIEKNFCGWVNIITSIALVFCFGFYLFTGFPSKWNLVGRQAGRLEQFLESFY